MTSVHPEPVHSNEWITPEKAEEYLSLNRLNRPISPSRVREFATMLEAGWWMENGEQGITFDWNGVLAGGQHFLEAIRITGKKVRVRVTRGVDPQARATMNDSRKQTFAQDLSTYGVQDGHRAEALLRKILIWEDTEAEHGTGGLAGWQGSSFGRGYLAGKWAVYAGQVARTIREVHRWHGEWGATGGNMGALAFMYWLITEKYGYSKAIATDFFNMIAFGAADEQERRLGSRLRNKFGEDRHAHVQVYWMCRVWNAWQKGEQLSKLQAPKGTVDERGRFIPVNPYPKLRKVS